MIYIGPKNVTTAGDAINIELDENCQLLDYVIERIELRYVVCDYK